MYFTLQRLSTVCIGAYQEYVILELNAQILTDADYLKAPHSFRLKNLKQLRPKAG